MKKEKPKETSFIGPENKYTTYLVLFVGILFMGASFYLRSLSNKQAVQPKVEESPEIAGASTVKEDVDISQEGDKEKEVIEEFAVDESFSAKSYLVYDVNSEEIIGGKVVDEQLSNASTTKLMTAYVSLQNYPLDMQLLVTADCVGLPGNNVGFNTGEKYLVQDLLYGLLLRSASDASCVLAENYPGGYDAFIREMNDQAEKLDLKNTNYVNPIGLDAENHYSSTRDLLNLILHLRDQEKLKIIMGTRNYTLKDLEFGNNYYISNTNELLFELPGTVGYKTGYTSQAGECLVFGYENFGSEVIIVIMGSENRFSDAKSLLNSYLLRVNN